MRSGVIYIIPLFIIAIGAVAMSACIDAKPFKRKDRK